MIAAKVLAEVLGARRHLDLALAGRLAAGGDPREQKLARELCYGVMRWYHRLDFIAGLMLNKPLKARDLEVLALVYAGLYQLAYLRVPDHAAISATVAAARKLHKPWAGDLVNALLRRYQRERAAIDAEADASEVARFSHPAWMIEAFRGSWPEHWRQILEADNARPPLHLRVNLQRHSREDCLEKLLRAGLEAAPSAISESGIVLARAVNVEQIPGFDTGELTVQDTGAQLAAPLLVAAPGQRVLDACAAPGGKTGHLLELVPGLGEMVAVDVDPARIALLNSTLNRLGQRASVVQADVSDTGAWWNGRPFDRILIDAPCSATGVIRRHPDIKYLRTRDQLGLFQATQQRLLVSLWPLLKPGGRLVYATCSILGEESDDQIASIINKYDDTVMEECDVEWGIKSQYGCQTLPGHDETDGFYYAVVVKSP